jgi:hypothetical protein
VERTSTTGLRGLGFLTLTLVAVLATSGCFLLDKLITDKYDAVHGIPMDTPQTIAGILLPRSYCADTAYAQISGKITQKSPGPNMVDLDVVVFDKDGKTIGSDLYALKAKPSKFGSTIPNQKFNVDLTPGNCIPDGGYVKFIATPRGADIEQNAALKTSFRVKRIP